MAARYLPGLGFDTGVDERFVTIDRRRRGERWEGGGRVHDH